MSRQLLFVFIIGMMGCGYAADKIIKLPEPDKKGGKTIMETFRLRQSRRDISAKPLTPKELSNLFFAATGTNRPDGRRTNPTARNGQDIILYAAMKDGLYRYNPDAHQLELEVEQDLRPLTGKHKWNVGAPLVLIPVSDFNKMKAVGILEEDLKTSAAIHIGYVAQNIYLFAASYDMATLSCMISENEKLTEAMKLPPHCFLMIAQPFGKR